MTTSAMMVRDQFKMWIPPNRKQVKVATVQEHHATTRTSVGSTKDVDDDIDFTQVLNDPPLMRVGSWIRICQWIGGLPFKPTGKHMEYL